MAKKDSIRAIREKIKRFKKQDKKNRVRGIRNIVGTPSQTRAVTARRIRAFLKRIGKPENFN